MSSIQATCSIENCTNKQGTYLTRYCSTHQRRYKKCGDPNYTVEKREKHGQGNNPHYRIWQAMKTRCNNPNFKSWRYYGGRGIKVCERWNESYLNFIEDMGYRPSNKHSLDRIDSDKDYTPGNCRWATQKVQCINKRNRNKTTGIAGVHKERHTYRVTIGRKSLGQYKSLDEAIAVRTKAYNDFMIKNL